MVSSQNLLVDHKLTVLYFCPEKVFFRKPINVGCFGVVVVVVVVTESELCISRFAWGKLDHESLIGQKI